ncbi:MAG: laccase domain-containing protein [Bacteroidales bacterium]|nr:laccase domain-containing protein [Bacteroidales bacterium]
MSLPLLTYNLGPGAEAFTTRRDSELPYPVTQAHQVHETRIAIVDRPGLTREDLEGYDALVTDRCGIAIGARTADCVPVLLHDPVKGVAAAIHAGWKGTVQRICEKTVSLITQEFGCSPSDILAAIGPAIGPDSFQVGEEVVMRFREQGFPMDEIWSIREPVAGAPMSGGHHIDLFRANSWLLERSGLMAFNISVCGIDTYTDTAFFSARREGIACGRNINCIRLV